VTGDIAAPPGTGDIAAPPGTGDIAAPPGTGHLAAPRPLVGVLGAGKLGEILVAGLLRGGWPADRLRAGVRRADRGGELAARHGIGTGTADQVAAVADVVVVTVKPQDAAGLLTQIAPALPPGRLVVSVVAGLGSAFVADRLPPGTRVVRVMTNTPARIAQGMSAISAGANATQADLDTVEQLLEPLGRTVRVPESQQDAVTALSGSGPAYFFYLVEAMTDAGILLGLPRQLAHDLIVQTAVGSALLLRESGEHPVTLREAVTSPAGTTISAIRELETHGVRAAMLAALEAARDRARQIAADLG
jgi:pyrroline-5-carboxylate reductase